ncbi:MAG: hypothetical protein LIP23_07035 [Planctomycetes bacterium]|nr:hypothetical protein [Planctomycetota bacterium]
MLKENGIAGTVSFGRDGQGKYILLQDHPEKDRIESLLNSDDQLKQISRDPANTFDFTQEGRFYSNGYDSAYFSEQAQNMYEERAANGQSAYASSVDETAKVMEWLNKPNAVQAALRADPFMEIKTHVSEIGLPGLDEEIDIANLKYAKSDTIKDLAATRNWLETEIAALMKKAGIDPAKLSGIQFTQNGNGIGMLVNQEGISEDDRATILGIINSSENGQLSQVMKRYLGEANAVANELQAATGLNDTDWAEVMANGGDFASVNNSGMQNLLSADPDLSTALRSLFSGGSGLLATGQAQSSRENAQNAVRGLGTAIQSVIDGGAASIGLSAREIADMKENLVVNVNSDGSYKVGGTSNSKMLGVIDTYVNHYLSDAFGKYLESGALLNQALGKSNAADGVGFTISFKNGKPNAAMQYGNSEPEKVKWWV